MTSLLTKTLSITILFPLTIGFLHGQDHESPPDSSLVAEAIDTMNKIEFNRAQTVNTILLRNAFSDENVTIRLIEKFLTDPIFAKDLELTKDQIDRLSLLREEINLATEEIRNQEISDLQRRGKIERIRRSHVDTMGEILLPFQLIEIGNWRVDNAGIPKVLTESILGNSIGLTDQQKKEMREKCQTLANEIEEFVIAKRGESRKIIAESLTEEQKRRLGALFSEEVLNQAMPTELEQIWKQFNYKFDYAPFSQNKIESKDERHIWQSKNQH